MISYLDAHPEDTEFAAETGAEAITTAVKSVRSSSGNTSTGR